SVHGFRAPGREPSSNHERDGIPSGQRSRAERPFARSRRRSANVSTDRRLGSLNWKSRARLNEFRKPDSYVHLLRERRGALTSEFVSFRQNRLAPRLAGHFNHAQEKTAKYRLRAEDHRGEAPQRNAQSMLDLHRSQAAVEPIGQQPAVDPEAGGQENYTRHQQAFEPETLK